MKSEVVEVIRHLARFSVLLPLLFYVFKWQKLPRENHVIGVLVILSGIAGSINFLLATARTSNALVFNLYCIAAFVVLSWYYYEVVFKFRCWRYFILGVSVYLLFLFIVTATIGVFVFQGEMWAISGLILFVFGIIYNNYQVEKPPLLDKNLYSGLIFNAAIMFYFSFNFFLFLIANYVLTELSPDTSRMVWAFHNVNSILKDVALAFGFYYTNRRRLNLPDEEIERIQWRHLQ